MGHHIDGWHRQVEDFLHHFYSTYARTGGRPFAKRFKVVPVEYDTIFREILATWNTNGRELLALGNKFGTDKVDQLLGWSQGAPEVDDNFFWTHAFDVIFYRFFATVREAVKVHVANTIFKEISNLASSESWSIIGHSLGTMVVHDTMHAWYTQPLGKGGKLGNHMRPRLLMMLANVGRILQQKDLKVLSPQSTVKPGGVCSYFVNALHPLDPFTALKPFNPVRWPDRQRYENGEFRLIEVKHIQEVNIHDFLHYLRHPDVITSLFRTLRYATFITQEKEAQYRQTFKPFGDLSDPKLIDIRKKLEDIGMLGQQEADTLDALLLVWERFQHFIQQG